MAGRKKNTAGGGKHKISYIPQEEPAFLKRFKQAAGYKEGPSIRDKFASEEADRSDRSDNEEEQPTVVVLKEGHLSAQEAKSEKEAQPKQDSDDEARSGRVQFRRADQRHKPTSALGASSKKSTEPETTGTEKEKSAKTAPRLAVKNTSLLSFGEDDEEEEDDD